MSGILYYISGVKGCPSEKQLAGVGLTEIFEGASPSFVGTVGPDGKGGTVFCVKPEKPINGMKTPRVGYYPDQQVWVKVGGEVEDCSGDSPRKAGQSLSGGGDSSGPAVQRGQSTEGGTVPVIGGELRGQSTTIPVSGEVPVFGEIIPGAGGPVYWIGIEKESPPGSLDLQRPELINGHDVELEGFGPDAGDKWLVPCARLFGGGTMLPERMRLGPAHEWVSEVLPRFSEFSAIAESLWSEFETGLERSIGENDDLPEPMSISEKCRICSMALSINYRVREEELSAMGTLTTLNIEKTLAAIVDLTTLVDMMKDHLSVVSTEKKSESPASDISSGGDGATGS